MTAHSRKGARPASRKNAVKRTAARKSSSRERSRTPEPQEFPVSHAMLRAMYDAMVESREWARSRNRIPLISEATAVSSAILVRAGDVLAGPADGCTLYPVTDRRATIIPLQTAKLRAACEQAKRSRRRIVLALCHDDAFDSPEFSTLLEDAQRLKWPLIVVLLSERYYNPDASIPEIDVDGHDAVAVYRVVGESVRRARNRRGPAVVHAHNADRNDIPDPMGDPLVRFQRYLEAKGLSTQRIHVVHRTQ